ncbi:MAG: hypothetical protein SWC96_05525 [Thermodesulfobacteriota bacterium]|nr:hypothetical protein [Thermodesulfobacteriota bacterium]
MKNRCVVSVSCLVAVCGMAVAGLFFSPVLARSAAVGDSAVTVNVVGTGVETQDTDAAAAKREAIDNGLSLAVDEAMRRVVTQDVLAANFADLDAAARAVEGQAILTYQVLADARRKDVCRVLVRASVSTDQVRRQVLRTGVLPDRENMPGVMLLLLDADNEGPAVAANQAMIDSLLKRGFRPVAGSESLLAGESGQAGADMTPARFVALGREMGVDFVVTGHVAAAPPVRTGRESKTGWQGTINARVVSTDTGREVFSLATEVMPPDEETFFFDKAMVQTAAGARAAAELSPAMAVAWDRQQVQTRSFDVTVRGVGYLAQLGSFRSAVESLAPVKRVQIREMKIDEALVVVQAMGGAEALADAIGAIRADGFYVQVLDVTENRMTVEIISDGH